MDTTTGTTTRTPFEPTNNDLARVRETMAAYTDTLDVDLEESIQLRGHVETLARVLAEGNADHAATLVRRLVATVVVGRERRAELRAARTGRRS